MTRQRGALSPVNRALGRELVSFRKRAGITQGELADRLRIHEGVYRRYEVGERPIDVDLIAAVAVALGVDPADIWRDAKAHSAEAFAFTEVATGEDV